MTAARLLRVAALALGVASCTRTFDIVLPVDAGMAPCTQQSTDPDCMPTPWPTGKHTYNSDPWLVSHNQVITVMKPKVLVLNFDNGQNSTDTFNYAQSVADALAAGSQYHGYSNSAAPQFLQYDILPVVDLTDSTIGPSLNSKIPLASSSTPTMPVFDPNALFNNAQYAQLYGYADPNVPGGFQSLCQLFENGTVNEVWIQDGGGTQVNGIALPRAPLYVERKMNYDENGHATGSFENCIGGGGSGAQTCLNIACNVTVRLAHLDPSPAGGPGCDVQVRGWGIEGMWGQLPSDLAVDANAFLNQDFKKFGVSFNSWSEICAPSTTCIEYPSAMRARSTSADTTAFDINPFLQGCGSSLLPPNATALDDFQNPNAVNSRCAGFGLRAYGGTDAYAPYSGTDPIISTYDQMYRGTSACPAGWEIYWRQSMPGYQNQATASDGTPMKNWWPVLFY